MFVQTSVQIPAALRDKAKTYGIGLSSTLTEALTDKIAERDEDTVPPAPRRAVDPRHTGSEDNK